MRKTGGDFRKTSNEFLSKRCSRPIRLANVVFSFIGLKRSLQLYNIINLQFNSELGWRDQGCSVVLEIGKFLGLRAKQDIKNLGNLACLY